MEIKDNIRPEIANRIEATKNKKTKKRKIRSQAETFITAELGVSEAKRLKKMEAIKNIRKMTAQLMDDASDFNTDIYRSLDNKISNHVESKAPENSAVTNNEYTHSSPNQEDDDYKIKKTLFKKKKIPPKDLSKFKKLGYSDKHLKQLKKTPKVNLKISLLIQKNPELKQFFSCDEIISIAKHNGGIENINAILNNYQDLINFKFNNKQILRIVSRIAGSKNIEAIRNSYTPLIYLGFNNEQQMQMVAHKGGSSNISAILESYQALNKLGFTNEQMVEIVGHDGGSNAVKAVLEHSPALKHLGFENNDIVKIAGNNGGSQNIKTILSNHGNLLTLGFRVKQIVQISSQPGSASSIKILVENHEKLIHLGFSTDQLTAMVNTHGGSKNIKAILENSEKLAKLGFTATQLVKIIAQDGGSHKIKTLIKNNNLLNELGFTLEQRIKIVSCSKGINYLKTISKNSSDLAALNFNAATIMKLLIDSKDEKQLKIALLLKKLESQAENLSPAFFILLDLSWNEDETSHRIFSAVDHAIDLAKLVNIINAYKILYLKNIEGFALGCLDKNILSIDKNLYLVLQDKLDKQSKFYQAPDENSPAIPTEEVDNIYDNHTCLYKKNDTHSIYDPEELKKNLLDYGKLFLSNPSIIDDTQSQITSNEALEEERVGYTPNFFKPVFCADTDSVEYGLNSKENNFSPRDDHDIVTARL